MAPTTDGIPRTRSRRARPSLVFVLVGAALGAAVAAVWLRTGPLGEIERTVARAAELALRDDVEGLWDMLSTETRRRLEESHARAVAAARYHQERRGRWTGAEEVAARIEPVYGMTLAEVQSTAPREFWVRRTRRDLHPSERAASFAEMRVESIALDRDRATVRCTLPNRMVQGFLLVRESGEWRLDDFHPYGPPGYRPFRPLESTVLAERPPPPR